MPVLHFHEPRQPSYPYLNSLFILSRSLLRRMTVFMDTKLVEARKAIYSQELAAYTLQQWDVVRRTMEDGSGSQAAGQPVQQQESRNVLPDSGTSSRNRHGMRGRSPPKTRPDSLHPRGPSARLRSGYPQAYPLSAKHGYWEGVMTYQVSAHLPSLLVPCVKYPMLFVWT